MNFNYEPLTKKQIEDVHQATLDLLENYGAKIEHEEARNIFKKHGAVVEGDIVKIPPKIINDAIKTTPGSYVLEGAVPGKSIKIGHNDEMIFGMNICAPYIMENDGTRREANLDDNINLMKIYHTCDFIDFSGQSIVFPVEGLSWDEANVESLYNYYKYTDKPCLVTDVTPDIISMVGEIHHVLTGDSKGYKINTSLSPISPLRYEKTALENLIRTVELKQVVNSGPCSISGMTGPIKLIDNVVLTNAENLVMIALVQLLEPGLPCLYSTFTGISDMRFMTLSVGAPESFKMLAMTRQICGYYDIPMFFPTGADSDARELDYQAVAESTIGLMTAFGSKPDIAFFAAGGLDSWNSFSLRKLILDEEIIRNIKAWTKDVDDLRPNAVELIAKVEQGGSYVTAKDTLKNYRKEYYQPNIFSRKSYQVYHSENEHIEDRLDKEIEKRVNSYQPLDYTAEQFKALDKIREKYLGIVK